MSLFDNKDPFEEIVRELFNGTQRQIDRSQDFIQSEEDERNIDFIEDNDYLYLIFELFGYNEKDVTVSVKGQELEIIAKKDNSQIEKVQDYLTKKLLNGIIIKKMLPKFVNPKNFKQTMKNGILEVIFSKNE
ncbi:hypothetical protein CXX78_00735 [Candidatus Parvarchaeota archaeon]|nr:MAG: hypothetical protein CXX78_01440 [Candidatus Parvarchaeota archaeon]PXY71494.1 MAG: hypothetical protein CXX78_00735 [Candidatus Parvarchaeota archaeon]